VTDSDDDVRVASIQLGVIRCPHTAVGNEDLRRSSVFYTYIAHERKNYKLMIYEIVVWTSLPSEVGGKPRQLDNF